MTVEERKQVHNLINNVVAAKVDKKDIDTLCDTIDKFDKEDGKEDFRYEYRFPMRAIGAKSLIELLDCLLIGRKLINYDVFLKKYGYTTPPIYHG